MQVKKGRLSEEAYILLGIGAGSVILVTALWLLPLATFPKDMPAAVLHYTVGTGIDFIGQSRQILVLPIIGTIVLFANGALAQVVKRASVQAFWIFWSVVPIIQAVLLIAYIAIWRAN